MLADVAKAGAPRGTEVGSGGGGGGGGLLFTEPVLVVSPRAKLVEVHNEYAIHTNTESRSVPSARSG